MFYTEKKHWTAAEKRFVRDNAGEMTPGQIARHLEKTEVAVKQYMHRYRINPAEKVVRNLVMELLTARFTNPDYFHPTREFYNAVGIGQKRWWELYYGQAPITDEEYKRLSDHLGVRIDDVKPGEQLSLFE